MTLFEQTKSTKSHFQTRFGLELPDNIVWRNWEPGKEYTKKVPIKNVKIRTQRIQYKVPTSQVFTSGYPNPITLSSGTSHVISVSFKPVERNIYTDRLIVLTEEGDIEIPVRATLPEPTIELVESVNFGLIAIKDTNSIFFNIRNTSEVPVEFRFDVLAPFTITPKHGNLDSKEECPLECTFTPLEAKVYSAIVICYYGNYTKELKLMGTGKFSYLQVMTDSHDDASLRPSLEFGDVPIGKSVTKSFQILNRSPVTAAFKVSPLWNNKGPSSSFQCLDFSGKIDSFGKKSVKVTFTPYTPDVPLVDYISVEAIGSLTESVITCRGRAVKPDVDLSVTYLEFGSVECLNKSRQSFEIKNRSKVVESAFQFLHCTNTIFSFEPNSGILKPGTSCYISVLFNTNHPLPYHRRVTCLVQNQEPLFIDMIATAYTDSVTPVVLRGKHLEYYANNYKQGLASYPPDQLKIWVDEGFMSVGPNGLNVLPETPLAGQLEIPETDCQTIKTYDFLFQTEKASQLSLSIHEIDFGYVSIDSSAHSYIVTATNNSNGKLICQWVMSENIDKSFSIFPEQIEIIPKGSFEFRIFFKPSLKNKSFHQTLECFAFYKTLKDYHLVDNYLVSPSWCCIVQGFGHTYGPKGTENVPSTISWDKNEIIFPPSDPHKDQFKDFVLYNNSNIPLRYTFVESSDLSYEIFPRIGLVNSKFQILIAKLSIPDSTKQHPSIESKLISSKVTCIINSDTRHPQSLIACATCEIPKVSFIDGDYLYFQPCVLNGSVKKEIGVRNHSRLPLKFDWSTQDAEPTITKVLPINGVIPPNEIQKFSWTFSPKKIGRCSFIGILTTALLSNSSIQMIEKISLIGDCFHGELDVSEKCVDFGDTHVRSKLKKTIIMFNKCQCSLSYKLHIETSYTDPSNNTEFSCSNENLILSHSEGDIPAGSIKPLEIMFQPETQRTYKIKIYYVILTTRRQVPCTEMLFEIRANVVYPSLSIVDLKLKSHSSHLGKPRLWEMFNIDQLNSQLAKEPSHNELRYEIATRHSMKRKIPVLTRAVVDIDFGSSPQGSSESIFQMLLQNPGPVPVEFAFQLPNDMYLEPEYWVDTGELDKYESSEFFLMENKIFSVDPKQGALVPNECQVISCSYTHKFIGENILPVLLKIRKGREILLNFKGITLAKDSSNIDILSDTFTFQPIPVGILLPPMQAYRLFNGGDKEATFEIDLSPLQEFTEKMSGLQVFQCINPSGVIQPLSSTEILWLFSPPEKKRYSVNLLLKVEGFEPRLLNFTGEGIILDNNSSDFLYDRQINSKVQDKHLMQEGTDLATLSKGAISFGHLPLFSPYRQLVFIRNQTTRTLSFKWAIPEGRVAQVITISKPNGYLNPNQHLSIQLAFYSEEEPSFYDTILTCVITDETSMLEYQRKFIEWETKENEQQHLFTITSNELTKKQKSSKDTRKSSIKRHNSLPPLEQQTETYEEWKRKDLSKKSKHRPRKIVNNENLRPIEPKPIEIDLRVCCRTHSIPDYFKLFPGVSMPFINTRGILCKTEMSTSDHAVSQVETEIISSILSCILYELISEKSFVQSLSKLNNEPIPYFSQLVHHKTRPLLNIVQGTQESFEVEQHTPSKFSSGYSEGDESMRKPTRTESAPSWLWCLNRKEPLKAAKQSQLDILKTSKDSSILVENAIEDILQCILSEASSNEINLTSKPLVVMLPQ